MAFKEGLIVSNLNLSLSDKVTVGVHYGEFMKARREGFVNAESTFIVKQGKSPTIQITTTEQGMPSFIQINAGTRLMVFEKNGFDFTDAKIGPNQIIIKKKKL